VFLHHLALTHTHVQTQEERNNDEYLKPIYIDEMLDQGEGYEVSSTEKVGAEKQRGQPMMEWKPLGGSLPSSSEEDEEEAEETEEERAKRRQRVEAEFDQEAFESWKYSIGEECRRESSLCDDWPLEVPVAGDVNASMSRLWYRRDLNDDAGKHVALKVRSSTSIFVK